jgi:hypothetical protein
VFYVSLQKLPLAAAGRKLAARRGGAQKLPLAAAGRKTNR